MFPRTRRWSATPAIRCGSTGSGRKGPTPTGPICPIQWPTPSRLPIGHLVNYGYEGETALLVEITPPAELSVGRPVEIKAQVSYLVCQRECIPGEAALSTSLPTTSKAEEDIFRTYDLSAASYITKPVTFDSLVEVVRTLGKYWLEIVELPGDGGADGT